MPNPIKERRNSLRRSPELNNINAMAQPIHRDEEKEEPSTSVKKPSIFVNAIHFKRDR